jgi:peptide deformylase
MQVVKVPNKILTKKAKPVSKFDKKLADLAGDMVETLKKAKNPEGVGLAAPQVGVSKRLFVMQLNPNTKKSKPRYSAFINPEIIVCNKFSEAPLPDPGGRPHSSLGYGVSRPGTQTSGAAGGSWQKGAAQSPILEGCLSIDNVWGYPSRSSRIKLAYQDVSGKKHTRIFSGFPAIIIQHEVDHLNGILFTHRVLEQKKELYKVEKDEETKKPVLISLKL